MIPPNIKNDNLSVIGPVLEFKISLISNPILEDTEICKYEGKMITTANNTLRTVAIPKDKIAFLRSSFSL